MDMGISFKDMIAGFAGVIGIFWWVFLIVGAYLFIEFVFGANKKSRRKGKKSTRGSFWDLFSSGKDKDKYDYNKYFLRKSVLSKNELDFYHCLKSIVGENMIILSKVRLLDIFLAKNGSGYYAALNRVKSKHVDFLLCSQKTFKPFLAIEVDDISHERKDRQERDEFVNELFESMGLPLLRYKAEKTYLVDELREQVSTKLSEHYFDEENGTG